MKRAKITIFLILTLFCFIPASKANGLPTIIGKWYGFNGSPIILEFRDNHTMSIKTEAFSSLSFTCHYKINYGVSPIEVDLTGIPGGMVCSAIVNWFDCTQPV